MSDFSSLFGQNLKKLRIEKGFSQKDFSTHLCTANNNLLRWEKGEVIPKIDIVHKMANALGCSIDKLCTEDTENNSSNDLTPQINKLTNKQKSIVLEIVKEFGGKG